MFLSAIVLALIVGALPGGGLPRLAELRLRWSVLLVIALALRLAVGISRETGFGAGDLVRLGLRRRLRPHLRVALVQLARAGAPGGLRRHRRQPAGRAPQRRPDAHLVDGLLRRPASHEADIGDDPFHFLLQADTVAEFVSSGGLFGDVIPLPIPFIRDVVSIGDVLLALGIFWAIVYSMTRAEAPSRRALALGQSPAGASTAGTFQTGLAYADASSIPAEAGAGGAGAGRAQSPYLLLVRNRNFSLLWTGQLVSLLGDRIHVIALGALVVNRGTALEVGLTFAATAVPSVVLGPLAGVMVDRWDRRRTMIFCDVARAALVLAVPFAIEIHIGLVYLMAFLISTITLLFRPAKTAVLPVIVKERDLVAANSAMSVPETAADLIGFPVAGLIVTALSSVIGAAFVLDAGTYLVSAVLIWAMLVPRQLDEPQERISIRAVWREMREGFAFLWNERALRSNTLLSTMAQVAVGAEIVVSLLYAKNVVDRGDLSFEQVYSLLLTAIAVGSVIAGIAVGAIGDRWPKGVLVIAGFIGMGLSLVAAGLVTDPVLAMIAFFFTGAANMLFIIPTVTLFQQRTPQRLMGRVVSSRQALVFGSIAASMGLSGYLAGIIGPALVLSLSGAICAAAGLIGLAVPSMRDAR